MSFSYSKTSASKEDAIKAITDGANGSSQVPDGIKAFILDGINSLNLGDRDVYVNVYGHLHNGETGNYEPSNASITIEPRARQVQSADESAAKAGA